MAFFKTIPTQLPQILKFVCSERLINEGSYTFNNVDEAAIIPVAQQLFYFPFVKRVLVATHFLSIERYDIVEWEEVQEQVLEQLEEGFKNGGFKIKKKSNSFTTPAVAEVYVESTPNPHVLKFTCNLSLRETALDISLKTNHNHYFFEKIFKKFPFIVRIFINLNYISITKKEEADWFQYQELLRIFILNELQKGLHFLNVPENLGLIPESKIESFSPHEKDMDIQKILKEYITPAVQSDGGDVLYRGFKEGTVYVSLIGACQGCPSSTITLKNGIEHLLKEMLPSLVKKVEAF